MSTSKTLLPPTQRPPLTFNRMLLVYILLVSIPFVYSLTQKLEYRGIYEIVLTYLNIMVFAALLAQYPLAGRINAISRVTGLDNGMRLHRKAGELIALFFLLHPFLILAPRFLLSPQRAWGDVWDTAIASEASTGVFAWAVMSVWVLMAMYKDKLKISYEAWRISHGIGFIAVAILGTHHAVTVGRHGRYEIWFDLMWIALCAVAVTIVSYIYFVQPAKQKRRPFKVAHVKKLAATDWDLTIEQDGDFPFDFDAGQFLWINTSGNPYNRTEHPFSIASSPTSLPKISFIIRELGDFTSQLDRLKPGQKVFVDGPYGVFTLNGREASGIALIAGGAGIGPNLGILRQLQSLKEERPVRLIYGNRRYDQMVCQDEIAAIESDLPDFRQTLALEQGQDGIDAHIGFIDKQFLANQIDDDMRENWIFYVCGPPVMVDAVTDHLRALGIPEKQILFEQLSFA
ncbi:ferric reductase-like transmembrane domain-containing protein [Altererythrobacter sp. ZODW24]|uniref:ferredoxin reductase family protein n=1 Tax=Altererythrobacter sp. ZODW24 TaxID=2185142 RepID=UPI000DF7C688|nr:ferric reductase-like transmembrane domain-containing protein [Altererythrobacter sp. ZODW24]